MRPSQLLSSIMMTCSICMSHGSAYADTFTKGDVLIAISNGQVQWRRGDGTFVATLTTAGGGYTTGMAFDVNNRLYVTNFGRNMISRFDTDGQLLGVYATGLNASPESIVFDAQGNMYVGHADGARQILKFDPTGRYAFPYAPAVERRGTDWIDLAQDQCTMFYTSEGRSVKRFDVCRNVQLADFNTLPLPGTNAFALRIQSGGGVLAADGTLIVQLDKFGNLVRAYDAPGQDCWFALNLDPDGTSFWSADYCTANVYKFDIATGTILRSFNTGTGYYTAFGLVVVGEITAAARLDVLDPVSTLLTADSAITKDSARLSTQGTRRQGVAADGVTRLVLRARVPRSGAVKLELLDASGAPLLSAEDYGAFETLEGTGAGHSSTVTTVATNTGEMAFLVYRAPARFVREGFATDSLLADRKVMIKMTYTPAGGVPSSAPLIPLEILRPPVVLVHGLWSTHAAWATFPLPSSRDCTDQVGFFTCRADYASTNAERFAVNASIVGSQIRAFVRRFRETKNVGALQADVIAHSMGGNIVRTMPLCGTVFKDCSFQYLVSANMRRGDVHRLATIGTPHLGSPLANRLWDSRSTNCGVDEYFVTVSYAFRHMGMPIGDAVEDLRQGSGAITGLGSVDLAFPVHYVIGIASAQDEDTANEQFVARVRDCDDSVLPADIRDVFGEDSDIIVGVTSQRNGLSDGAEATTDSTVFGNTVHAAGLADGMSFPELAFVQLGGEVVRLLGDGAFTK